MNIIIAVLAISLMVLSGYGLLNPSVDTTTISMVFLGALLLTMGVEAIPKEKKTIGYLLIIGGLFNIFVSVIDFF
ncbi:DUF3953 domain-containing protein [Oceanobacillus piezotolerans]|uniref:DUF3953 domain-containing protein n=1 Tax=Oceanobacillus piezotolerans TaxID=2448030 RepID=A0A498DDN0_9BACI|nr:DUF3953 domain-containing protein [Oceanobacillus piezotolerans]RLL48312.1 DUF3953 domain-containing protein [Oceanobacillus piezotolerans]